MKADWLLGLVGRWHGRKTGKRRGYVERSKHKLAEERKVTGELFMLTKLVGSCVGHNNLPGVEDASLFK